MPLYEYRCRVCGARDSYFRHVEERNDVPSHCNEKVERLISAPMVAPDLPGYESPVTGRWVEGKVQRREDLLRNDCVEYDSGMKTEAEKRRKSEDQKFEKSVGESVERFIDKLPVRKKEKLAEEIQAGAGAQYVRSAPV